MSSIEDPNVTLNKIRKVKRIAVIMGILVSILVIILLLLHSCHEEDLPQGSVDIPGNIIDPPDVVVIPKADLVLYNASEEENQPFYLEKMDGGHSKSILYRIIATYNSDFILNYDMSIRDEEEFQKLAEVLKIKVELVGAEEDVLYDGLISSMETLEIALSSEQDVLEELLFKITVYLDAPLDEQYYGQKLYADMSWWIEDQDHISIANNAFSTVSASDPDDPDDPDNPDDPAPSEPELNFIEINEGDNTAFDMTDIQNGDSESKYFAFEVLHSDDVKLVIGNTVVLNSNLSKVLKVKVELVGNNGNETLYEGLLKGLSAEHTVRKNNDGKTNIYYKITVTATGLTEAYYGMKMISDLSWSLDGTSEQLKVPSNSFEAYEKPATPPTPPDPPKPPTATSIELVSKEAQGGIPAVNNVPFVIEDKKPGDEEVEYYCVSVTHDRDHVVHFSILVDTNQVLSDVMRVKVEWLIPDEKDELLYDGLMKDCVGVDVDVPKSATNLTEIYYRITVYTNGKEVKNEHAGKSLDAEFHWELR